LLGIVNSENGFCKKPTSKDTITTIDSESYDSIGGHKHSLDQDTRVQAGLFNDSKVIWVPSTSLIVCSGVTNSGFFSEQGASATPSRKVAFG